MTQYQVASEMVSHVEVHELGGGKSVHAFYQGAVLPEGVPDSRIQDLLAKGSIVELGTQPIAPNAAVQQDPARGLDSVTVDELRGEQPDAPREDPMLEAGRQVAETVTEQGAIDKATQDPAADPAVEQKRAQARQKLAELGTSAPDGRASQAVWVEYLVGRGSNYDDVKDVSKAELIKLVEQQNR